MAPTLDYILEPDSLNVRGQRQEPFDPRSTGIPSTWGASRNRMIVASSNARLHDGYTSAMRIPNIQSTVVTCETVCGSGPPGGYVETET